MLEPFTLPYVQRALLEIVLLAVAGGLLGTWIVLRGLAFYAHAVATATFPGLVLAGGLGVAPPLGAGAVAAAFTAGVAGATRRERAGHGAATALVLVGALAAGVVLASDVFHSAANVESLLFGSLLVVSWGDVALAGAAAALALAATLLLGRRWLAVGFDEAGARALGMRSAGPDVVLLALVALTAVAALAAVGALLASALLVVPAATARLHAARVGRWQAASIALAAAEGIAGVLLAFAVNAPPGATIAVLAGGVFALAAAARALRLPAAAWRPALALGGVALVAGVVGCGAAGPVRGRLDVVATTTQLADFARHVGGDAVAVHQILEPNTDPHDYEPRPADVRAVAGADLVVASGDGLDHWIGGMVREAGGDARVLDAGAAAVTRVRGDDGGVDPHWWHDPVNAEAAVSAIGRALAAAEPAQRAAFERRARRYRARIAALRRAIAGCMARLPRARRTLVTDHDAFGYFARRFGIRVIGAVIPSQSTHAQASAGDVAALVDTIRAHHVRAVFPEASVNAKLAQAVARETGARADLELYGDTLGPGGSPGATYLGMEAANADAMMRGFTGGRMGCAAR